MGLSPCLRAILELGTCMWLGQAMFRLFYNQAITEGMFTKSILRTQRVTLKDIGTLDMQLLLVLGISALGVFVLTVLDTRGISKVCFIIVPPN